MWQTHLITKIINQTILKALQIAIKKKEKTGA